MTKVVVVEVEVDEDAKGVVSQIAAALAEYTILSIGLKQPSVSLHRGTDDLAERTRYAVR